MTGFPQGWGCLCQVYRVCRKQRVSLFKDGRRPTPAVPKSHQKLSRMSTPTARLWSTVQSPHKTQQGIHPTSKKEAILDHGNQAHQANFSDLNQGENPTLCMPGTARRKQSGPWAVRTAISNCSRHWARAGVPGPSWARPCRCVSTAEMRHQEPRSARFLDWAATPGRTWGSITPDPPVGPAAVPPSRAPEKSWSKAWRSQSKLGIAPFSLSTHH
ncbi:uncharacterized protein B0H64DRAFT_192257 [Chaetomium fimeti]|uniref:Uncharacterized protein n=1 Tax=Chaetomium fimeti TaxID=1854472 RepID=A0AAE0HFF0_9PEZI|nr:hypothetical protein B0H64DRAFT_192257 [Chaetomium fimeti]